MGKEQNMHGLLLQEQHTNPFVHFSWNMEYCILCNFIPVKGATLLPKFWVIIPI